MQFINSSLMMIEDSFQIITTLGIGGAGEVYSVKNIKNNQMYAAKYARKDLKVTENKKLTLLQLEKDAMWDLQDHPNILKSVSFVQKRQEPTQCTGFDISKQGFDAHLTTSPFHLIEYCQNGSMITYLKKQEALPEEIVAFYAEQLIGCLEYIHYKGYAHLDLKLDNILLDDSFNIRLSDFGSAIKLDDQSFTVFRRGTPKYMAPEVYHLKNNECFDAYKADVYSLGVCIYLMLFKRFPKLESTEYPTTKDLLEDSEICKWCPFDCDKLRWSKLSSQIQRIVLACLNADPEDRPTSNELLTYFYLPELEKGVDDRVFEEMEDRHAQYEQFEHEKRFQFVQESLHKDLNEYDCSCDSNKESPEKINSHWDKTGGSTYQSTNTKNNWNIVLQEFDNASNGQTIWCEIKWTQ